MDLFRKLYLNWIKVGTKKELTSEYCTPMTRSHILRQNRL